MRYLKICNANNMNEYNDAFRELGIDYNASLAENRAKFCAKWGIVEDREEVTCGA